ncbi:VapE domain-containing protein [uncultured Desulfobulbus sp.]|uniref:VapE domain-containing protein n=1 Tax=uncultured Desulfobulbus sp. TaxID=239745 RepID=UPI0029C67A98|nr:VapE domain-containing protein [uncultured Desulfobulbus sp.]
MKHLDKNKLWAQIASPTPKIISNVMEGSQDEVTILEPSPAMEEVESSVGDAQIDTIDIAQDNVTSGQTFSNEPQKSPSADRDWCTAKDKLPAAMHAYGFGFKIVPILHGTTTPAVEMARWVDNLSPGTICDHWKKNSTHDLYCIIGDDLIVIEAIGLDSIVKLTNIENKFGMVSNFVFKMDQWELHFYQLAPGVTVKPHSKESRLNIKTGEILVALPPSKGTSFSIKTAENKGDLVVATQSFIDAIDEHTAEVAPSIDPNPQEEVNNTLAQGKPEEVDPIVESTQDINTPALLCAAPKCKEPNNPSNQLEQRKQPVFSLDNAKPIDPLKFPNAPHPHSKQLPATIPNIAFLLAYYGVTVRYNVIKKKLMITMPNHVGSIDNMDNVMITYIITLVALNGMATGQVPAIVEALADRNMYNPAADWIASKPWDGKDRLSDICETITVREGYPIALRNTLICKWLLSAVAAALMPSGFKTRGVLTFQGEQNIGKTSWVLSLVPDFGLCNMMVKVDHHMDGGNKDSIIGAICHWLVEIGELEGSFKKDITRLKGILTSNSDKIRRPYARTESEYQRRTVFIATVNQPDFLVDSTGNSRWWTIPVQEINYKHGVDMQQVFAQLAVDFHNGAEWWLTKEEEALLSSCNSEHRSISVIRELLLDKLDLGLIRKDDNPAMSAIEVLNMIKYDRPTNPQCKECTGILRELLGEPKKNRGIYKWRTPLKRSSVLVQRE